MDWAETTFSFDHLALKDSFCSFPLKTSLIFKNLFLILIPELVFLNDDKSFLKGTMSLQSEHIV